VPAIRLDAHHAGEEAVLRQSPGNEGVPEENNLNYVTSMILRDNNQQEVMVNIHK
jgi:hypothetical protein